MLNDKELPTNYEYDHKIKELKYRAIITALKGVNKEIKHACTFTGNSNYQFERMLVKSFPGISVHCFENDINEALKNFSNAPTLPEGVSYTLLRKDSSAEEYIRESNEQYDLIWFDYKGGPLTNLTGLILKNLEVGGLFAMTTYAGHFCSERNADISLIPKMKPAINLFKYRTGLGHMQFSAFWKAYTTLRFPELITIRPVDGRQENDMAKEESLTPFHQRIMDRNNQILELSKQGLTHREIGNKLGLGHGAVDTIFYRYRLRNVKMVETKVEETSSTLSTFQQKLQERNQQIVEAFKKGMSRKDLTAKFNTPVETVGRVIRLALGVNVSPACISGNGPVASHPDKEKIIATYKKGNLPVIAVAKKYNISRSTLYLLLRGVTRRKAHDHGAFDLTDAYQYYDLLSKSDQVIIDLVKEARKASEIAKIMRLSDAALYHRMCLGIPKKLAAAKAGKKVWNLKRPNEYIPNLKEALALKHAA